MDIVKFLIVMFRFIHHSSSWKLYKKLLFQIFNVIHNFPGYLGEIFDTEVQKSDLVIELDNLAIRVWVLIDFALI